MKTYILKYPVYNSIDFPVGTIVKLINERYHNFEVVEGNLKGQRGCVADGLEGWLIDDTPANRGLFLELQAERGRLKAAIQKLNHRWDNLPTANIVQHE